MPSSTEIEALDSVANEIALLRQLLSSNFADTVSINNTNIEILKALQKSISQLHNDQRSMLILYEFWEQLAYHNAELLVGHSVEALTAGMSLKGEYYSSLISNKNVVTDNMLPVSELSLSSVYSNSVAVASTLNISVLALLNTVSHQSGMELTIASVSAGPRCKVTLEVDNQNVIFGPLSTGTTYFTYTVISSLGTEITGIANITITP